MKFRLILLLLVSGYLALGQQTVKTETVGINLSAKDFLNAIPFDIPFKIRGDADAKVQKIIFEYRIKDRTNSDWYYFPPKPADKKDSAKYTPAQEWKRVSSTDNAFAFLVGPMHPNVMYEFHFVLYCSIELGETESKALKEDLLKLLHTTLDKTSYNDKDITDLSLKIEEKVKSVAATEEILDKKGNAVKLEPFGPTFKYMSDRIRDINIQIDANNKTTDAARKDIVENQMFKREGNLSVREILIKILSKDIKLDEGIEFLLDKPLNSELAEFQNVKLNDFILFYSNELTNITHFENLLLGKNKISNNAFVPATEFHRNSVQLWLNFLRLINSDYFIDTNKKKIFKDYYYIINDMISDLEDILNKMDITEGLKKESNSLMDLFPDILKDKLTKNNYILFEGAQVDVMTEKTPYVGLDAGLVYVPMMQNIFVYQGANIYLKPVNRKARLSTLEGYDRFAKIFSIYIGITQKAGGPVDPDYKPLFNDVGSLLTGFGFRFNRIARINIGGLFYQYKNPNPVLNKYDLNVSPTISLSVDLDVVKAFGDLGKLFGFYK